MTAHPHAIRERLRRIEEIEADVADSDDAVGELLVWARHASAEVRGQAYRALADWWEDPRMLPFLLRALDGEPDHHAKGLVCIGLGRFLDAASDEGALEPDYEPDLYTAEPLRDAPLVRRVYERLLKLATEPEIRLPVRRRALESLGSFAYRSDVAALIEDMYTSGDDEAQVSALFAMGRSGLKRYRKRLLKHLDDPSEKVQFEAIQAVEWWELRAALPHLRRIAIDPDNPNRGDALIAYARYAPTAKVRSLLREVRDRLPDPVIEEILPEVQEQILDDFELGNRDDDEGLDGLFSDD